MKRFFISMLAVAALVGCAKEETISFDKGEVIGFSSFVDNATRATSATDPSYSTNGLDGYTQLTQFNVYGAVGGVNIFNGNVVLKGTAAYNSPWTLVDGTTQYWINGADYEFVAIVDGNKTVDSNVITSTTIDTTTGMPTSVTYNSDGATDLLCARVERKKDAITGNTDTSLVAFSFTHLLSKVKFSVENTSKADATNYQIVLTEAKITGALASDVYNISGTSGAWDTTNANTTKDFTLENLTIASNSTQYHPTELLLIPGVNVGVVVKAKVEALDAKTATWKEVATMEKTFTNVLGSSTLVANNAYHFAVKLGIGSEIEFTATTLPEWTDGDGDDDTQLN